MDKEAIQYHPQRPLSFNVLCILAFGFGGISILINLALIITGSLSEIYREIHLFERVLGTSAHQNAMIYSFLGLFLSLVAFVGVIQMWNQMRSGFWLFTVSNIMYLILPFILLDIPLHNLFFIMLPFMILIIFFIVLFKYNMKYLD